MFYLLLLKVYSFAIFSYEEKYICWSTRRQKKHAKCVLLIFVTDKTAYFFSCLSCFITGLFDNKFIFLVWYWTHFILRPSCICLFQKYKLHILSMFHSVTVHNCDHLFAEVHTLAMWLFSMKWKRNLTRCLISACILMFCYLDSFCAGHHSELSFIVYFFQIYELSRAKT